MDSVEQLCRQLASSEQEKVYQARQEMARRTAEAGSPGQDQQRNELAAKLAAQLAVVRDAKDSKGNPTKVPALSAQGRALVARYLANVGGDDEVPVLVAAMQDFDVREMARWALTRMICPAATAALIEAATSGIGNEFRVGAINGLSDRSGPKVIEALTVCLSDPTPEIRLAAVEALANHADPEADAAIAKAAAGHPRAARRVVKARLRLAEKLVSAGQPDAAKQIYQSIASGKFDAAQKKAAAAALARLG
jgi:HEAT repeat protein